MPSPGTCTLEAQMTGGDAEAQRGTGFARGHRAREEHVAESPRESTCRSAFPTRGTNRHGFVSPDGGVWANGRVLWPVPPGPLELLPRGCWGGGGRGRAGQRQVFQEALLQRSQVAQSGLPGRPPAEDQGKQTWEAESS